MENFIENIKSKTYNFLRWSEKYAKTDVIYLISGGFWLTLGQIAASLSAFILSIFFARLLPKEAYGTYKYVLSIAGLLTITTIQGMDTAVAQAAAKRNENSLPSVVKIKIRWGSIGGIASLILAFYYYTSGNMELFVSLLIASIFVPFMDSFLIYDSFLSGKKLFKKSTEYAIACHLFAITVLAITLLATKSIPIVVAAYFFSWTFARFVCLKITINKFPPNQTASDSTISYGRHLSFIGILNTVAAQIDKILIFHYFGAVNLAVYSFAIALPEQMKGFIKNINALALPKFAERSTLEIKKKIYSKMIVLSLATLPVVFIYIFSAPLIYKILFPKYLESVFYSQIFALSLVTVAAVSLPVSAMEAHAAKRQLYFFNILSSAAQIISLFTLISLYGLIGAIIARIISRIFVVFLASWLIRDIQSPQKTEIRMKMDL